MSNKRLSIKRTIYQHIVNNSKEYILVTLIFIVGLFIGVMFINNIQEEQMQVVKTYLDEFINTLKNNPNINNISILRTTIIENIVLALILWFFGTTVIRNTYCFWCYII